MYHVMHLQYVFLDVILSCRVSCDVVDTTLLCMWCVAWQYSRLDLLLETLKKT